MLINKLEKKFGGDSAILTNTKQNAVQMCLELLGSRSNMIPVIMPITASIEMFTGVLYSGAVPYLLDIDSNTHQVQLEPALNLLKEVKGGVVVLSRPAGLNVPGEVLEAFAAYPTIMEVPGIPDDDISQLGLCGTFNVLDFTQLVGTGGIIFHKYPAQQKELRMIRDGVLGHNAAMPEAVCDVILNGGHQAHNYTYRNFKEELLSKKPSDILLRQDPEIIGYMYVVVPNARRVIAHLKSYDITVQHAFYPLHLEPLIRKRFVEVPEYPNAMRLYETMLRIPTCKECSPEYMVKRILEVAQ